MKRNLSRVLKQKTPALKLFFASDPRVLGVFLFGSQADGSATARSDIDLAVLFDRDLTFQEELAFEVAVSQILETDNVDVVHLNRASHPLRFRAIAGNLLYERDYVRVSDFIERTLIDQREYAHFIERFNADYFEGMRQDYGKLRSRKNQHTPQNHRRQPAIARRETR